MPHVADLSRRCAGSVTEVLVRQAVKGSLAIIVRVHRGVEIAWVWSRGPATAIVTGLSLCHVSPATAQVVRPPSPAVDEPWNSQQVFEPVPFAKRWEAAGLDEVLPEDTPVKTRVHEGYKPIGIRAGTWMFVPSLTMGGIYNSNVFASRTSPRGDSAFRVNPSLLAYTLTERHALAVQADLQSDTYRQNSNLDQVNANVRARGRLDLRHDMMLLTNFRAARLNDSVGSLESPTGAIEPTPYSLVTGDATYLQKFNRLTASVGARVDSYSYGSTRAQNGSIIDQSGRDGQVYSAHSRLEYVLSPKFGVFASVEGNRRELRGTPAQPLSSEGYRALTGVNVEFSRLLSGEIGIGYADQQFDAATIGKIVGPAYRAQLTWSPTRTIDVKFKAESIVTQAIDTSPIGIRANALQLGVDYEFRRNVIISLAAIYENDRFFGQPRVDINYIALAELKYLLNRHWAIALRHRYTDRRSNFAPAVFERHEIGLNVTAQF